MKRFSDNRFLVRASASLLALFAFALSLVSFAGCRGYHLGNQYLYRSDIRSVHVATLESESWRRFLGQRLTEAITKQIISSTPLTVTEPSFADSFITGRLVRETKTVTGETITDEGAIAGHNAAGNY